MASMLFRNKNPKPAKKTMDEHVEDALYREISEEVHAEKAYGFVKKHMRLLAAGAMLLAAAAVCVQLVRHNRQVARGDQARIFERALEFASAGNRAEAEEAFVLAASRARGGMSDLALWESALMDLRAGAGDAKLGRLAVGGATRDFRDLALLRLGALRGDEMTGAEFEKFLSPVLTERSPFFYTGMLMVAQKYLAEGGGADADKWLSRIINDKNAPASVSAFAETLR
jgi:hypothetical protein